MKTRNLIGYIATAVYLYAAVDSILKEDTFMFVISVLLLPFAIMAAKRK